MINRPEHCLRILIVEDHADTAAGMARWLGRLGHYVQTVPDATAALEAAQPGDFEVVFLDIGLPGMDGWELAKRLRQLDWRRRPMFIAITGHGSEEDQRRSAEAEIDLHLVKPADPEDIRDLLNWFHSLLHAQDN